MTGGERTPPDEEMRKTIVLHHFLKGLGDQQAAIHIGMTSPDCGECQKCLGYLHQPARSACQATWEEVSDSIRRSQQLWNPYWAEGVSGWIKIFCRQPVQPAEIHAQGEARKVNWEEQEWAPKGPIGSVECCSCYQHGHYASECPKAEAPGVPAVASKPVRNC